MVAGKTLWIGLNTYVLNPNGHQFFLFAQLVEFGEPDPSITSGYLQ
jgi:hypothetical protein